MTASSFLVLLSALVPAYGLVLASPGPNLLVVLRASLSRCVTTTAAAALGVGLGAGLAAFAALVAAQGLTGGDPGVLWELEFAGRLIFVLLLARAGWRSLRRAGMALSHRPVAQVRPGAGFRLGLFAAMGNPVTLSFFAAFFLGHPETRPLPVALAACGVTLVMAAVWFTLVGLVVIQASGRDVFMGCRRWAETAVGFGMLAYAGFAAWPLRAYFG